MNDQESAYGESAFPNCQPDLTLPPVVDIGGEYRVPIVFCEEEDSLCTSQALGQAAGMAVTQHAGATDCMLCIEEVLQAFVVALPPSTAA